MYLTKLEVSQKQAYIFGSNKLKDNICNSAIISKVLSPEYIEKKLDGTEYDTANNMVYSGGGHTVLEFATVDMAKKCVRKLTETIYREFDGLTVFAKTVEYDDALSVKENMKRLSTELEIKKSVRKSAFHQGTYGIEKADTNTHSVIPMNNDDSVKTEVMRSEKEQEQKLYPEGCILVDEFDKLGGEKGNSNFIAVVHIDGNGMGKRVEEIYDTTDAGENWNSMKIKLAKFSEEIDKDFKEAYKSMTELVKKELDDPEGKLQVLKLKPNVFPIRRVISAGDDICFVTEGRIGIECARIFLEELCKLKNDIDNRYYSACAGVAIVHTKYPFFKAYELAEMLCSNAKKYGALIDSEDNGRSISSIDWHVEFGELGDDLKEIRKSYETADGSRLEARPYIVGTHEFDVGNCDNKVYGSFKKLVSTIQDSEETYAVGKIKGLRNALKGGEIETTKYLTENRMMRIAGTNKEIFIEQPDGKKHSLLFDAIEILDNYLPIG